MKTFALTLLMLICALPGFAMAADMEPELPADNRIKWLPYDESDIYTVQTKFGYQTNIVFEKGEEIETISMGDRSLWQIIPSQNRLFIRPMDEDVTTNMTVLTNKRSYQFDLVSVEHSSKRTDIVYVAKFIYPGKQEHPAVPYSPYDEQMEHVSSVMPPPVLEPAPPVAMTPITAPAPISAPPAAMPPVAPPPVAVVQAPVAKPGFNYNYTYSGPDELAPMQVFDDGKSTYFKYQNMGQPLPNVYIMAGGASKPVGHYVKDKYMVVDDIAREWVLKNSAGTIMVYNEMLNPK